MAEFQKAKQTADDAKAEISKREKELSDLKEQLTLERQAIQSRINTLNTTADEATAKLSETEKRVTDLTEQSKSVSAQVEQLTTERDAAQSKLSEKQSEFEAMENELAKAKESNGTGKREGFRVRERSRQGQRC